MRGWHHHSDSPPSSSWPPGFNWKQSWPELHELGRIRGMGDIGDLGMWERESDEDPDSEEVPRRGRRLWRRDVRRQARKEERSHRRKRNKQRTPMRMRVWKSVHVPNPLPGGMLSWRSSQCSTLCSRQCSTLCSRQQW